MEDNKIEAISSLRNHKGSPRKARLVLDLIRGKRVAEAKNILMFSNKRMATHALKLLNSACANATQKATKIDIDNMIINKAFADGGQIAKRWRPRAKSSATTILKRSCHITIGVVSDE
jgi:large subunit ribosomal protein L22